METSFIPEEPANARERILAAAAALLASGGSEAATTRAVAAAAGVQAPTLYRLFGDKDGLLAAVAEQVMADYVAAKDRAAAEDDAVVELRRGWDDYIGFGLSHPAVFTLISGPSRPVSSASAAGLAVLARRVHRVARAGRLRVTEKRAVDLIHACGTGTVLTLIAKPPDARDDLAIAAREAVMAAILDEPRPETSAATAMATGLRASLPDIPDLTPGERHLLDELLQRIARACG